MCAGAAKVRFPPLMSIDKNDPDQPPAGYLYAALRLSHCGHSCILQHSGDLIFVQRISTMSEYDTTETGLWMVKRVSLKLRLITRTSVADPAQSGSVQIVSRTETRQAAPLPRYSLTSRLMRYVCHRAFATCIRLRSDIPPLDYPGACSRSNT